MQKPDTSAEPSETGSPGLDSMRSGRLDQASGAAVDLDLRFRILSAEYSHLTSVLTNTWTVAAQRTNLFFVAVSAAGVALALLANASHATAFFPLLALAVLLLVLLLGVAALARMLGANREATRLLQSLNRIRHFFVEIDAGAEKYMALPTTDDDIALFGIQGRGSSFAAMTQMPAASMATLVALIDAFVIAAITGIVYFLVSGGNQLNAVIAAGIALTIGIVGFEGWAYLDLQRTRRSLDVRFPTPGTFTKHGPLTHQRPT
jgi:hypothetical protein